jgi:hypothetical protein
LSLNVKVITHEQYMKLAQEIKWKEVVTIKSIERGEVAWTLRNIFTRNK